MFADISWSGNKSRLLMSGHKCRKTTTSFKTRTFKMITFDGDTCDDNVERGIRSRAAHRNHIIRFIQ